ncbi:unnamed protein product [Echinostoma caproni]|uniref:Homeobox domain-containing protein n=1 Tax=Echinostoma caproni TaxID=27848 RepID=A0A183A102_9TREM|nr:unnamed protein product [Echinostoma caproni]
MTFVSHSPLRELRNIYNQSNSSTGPCSSATKDHNSEVTTVEFVPGNGKANETTSTQKPRQYRKARAYFQPQHMKCLETFFQRSPYLSTKDRELLSKQLNLSEDRIRTWFQNRRMREKRNPERFGCHVAKFHSAGASTSVPKAQ